MFLKRKPVKIFAYETLIKYNVTSLPVPLEYHNGIKIYTLQLLAEYHHENVSDYFNYFGYRGFVCYEPEFDNYIIFINENDSKALQRWSVSIAIGFIESHKIKKIVVYQSLILLSTLMILLTYILVPIVSLNEIT